MKQGFISLNLSETLDFEKFAIKCVPETFHSHLLDSFKYSFSRGETLANIWCKANCKNTPVPTFTHKTDTEPLY